MPSLPSSSLLAARPATQSSPCLLGRPSMRPSQIIRVHGNGLSFVSLYPDRRAPRWLDERLRLSARTHKNPSGSHLLSSSLLHLLPSTFTLQRTVATTFDWCENAIASPSRHLSVHVLFRSRATSAHVISFSSQVLLTIGLRGASSNITILLSYAHFLVANCRCNVQASAPQTPRTSYVMSPASSLAAFGIH